MRLTALAIIMIFLIGTATSQTKYPKTVIIDTSFNVSDYFGDTVTMYSPGQIMKIGKRLMIASSLEQELGAYKVMYSHCDSLRQITDSTKAAKDEKVSHLETINNNLDQELSRVNLNNLRLSEIIAAERKKSRRQKYIYGFSGTGAGIVAGLILGIVLR